VATLLVGYDLNKPGADYDDLFAAIKGAGSDWWHCLDSTWLVKTTLSVTQLRDRLRAEMDANDSLLVMDVTGRARAWVGFSDECSAWLKDRV
jgi:hypothetical protein